MNHAKNKLLRVTLAVTGGIGCLLANGDIWFSKSGSLVTTADARIGRPLTPMSYAGVARRTTRRAVAVGAAVATTACVQAVDAYGRIYTRCY